MERNQFIQPHIMEMYVSPLIVAHSCWLHLEEGIKQIKQVLWYHIFMIWQLRDNSFPNRGVLAMLDCVVAFSECENFTNVQRDCLCLAQGSYCELRLPD